MRQVVILAAGKGVRMRSAKPKVLHHLCGLTLIERVLRAAAAVKPSKITVVVGAGEAEVRKELNRIQESEVLGKAALVAVRQAEQKGTGHAVQIALPELDSDAEEVIILPGDLPLLSSSSLLAAIDRAREENADVLMLTFSPPDAAGFGRVIRNSSAKVIAVREKKDCSPEEERITEVNSSVYVVKKTFLEQALKEALSPNNAQGELYLTDIIEFGVKQGSIVSTYHLDKYQEASGVNDRVELAELAQFRRNEINSLLLEMGVAFEDPRSVYVDEDVEVASDCFLGAGTRLYGRTVLGHGVIIEGDTVIKDSTIEEGVIIQFCCHIERSFVKTGGRIGPFAHLRHGTELGEDVHIGNFVETKQAKFDEGAKANHLSYIGDAAVGAKTNIGAGTITCNYDGYRKSKTVIGPGVMIGSNTNLVAPVKVGADAATGAGSTIYTDVPPGALAIERSEQRNVLGWTERKRKKEQAK